ncbi:MAG TPA: helical backbone metal receptor [Kofleriaceae bacterium]|jgi:ABC-type Fe3+-hydroxamate transport system substrate-binding protein|nr:helical backbone metal receptor [Kofleriaceae bacterium]
MAVKATDDLGRELVLYRPPQRIVSLVPSDTLTLFDLGAGERVVGRTRYCIEPAGRVDAIADVGGTKDTDVDAVLDLQPDLVIANQEENARPPLERLRRAGVNLFVSFPRRVGDGLAHVARLARLLGLEADPAARELVRRGYQALRAPPPAARPLPTFLPIWFEPLMTISGDTFASDMLALCGAENVFADRVRRYPLAADLGQRAPLADEQVAGRDTRYPRITVAEVAERAPEAVLLPDEPHPFGATEAAFFAAQPIPAARLDAIRTCDGKDLFWYGSRTIDALPRLRALVDSLRRRD